MTTPAQKIKLTQNKSQVIINLLGFKIELLILNNQTIFDTFVRGDNKTASSHPCLPIFGPETNTKYNLAQHGETRNSLAKITKQAPTHLELEHLVNEGNYPVGLIFKPEFELTNDSFTLKSTFKNTSHQPLPLNFAEHFYWKTPIGWPGLKINNKEVSDLVKTDKGFFWQTKNVISIPGQNDIYLEQSNLPYCQMWSYSESNKYDENYVCIEPAQGQPRSSYFGSPASLIKPGETVNTEIKVSLK